MTVLPPVLAPRLTTPNALVFLRRFVKVACPARSPAAPRSQPELLAHYLVELTLPASMS